MRRGFLLLLATLSACAGAQRPAPAAAPARAVAPLAPIPPPADPGLAAASTSLPRRDDGDLVTVAVFEPVVPTALRLRFPPAAVATAVQRSLGADPRLRIRPLTDVVDRLGRRLDTLSAHVASAAARDPQLLPDLWLLPRVEAEEGAPGTAVLKVEITSGWDGAIATGASGLPSADALPGPELRAAVEQLLPGLPARGPALTLVATRESARQEAERLEGERKKDHRAELERLAGIQPEDDSLVRTRKLQEYVQGTRR
jgi:hypothetical protein